LLADNSLSSETIADERTILSLGEEKVRTAALIISKSPFVRADFSGLQTAVNCFWNKYQRSKNGRERPGLAAQVRPVVKHVL
jgi:hypothetical protein